MRSFVASLDPLAMKSHMAALRAVWESRMVSQSIGQYLTLYWDALRKRQRAEGVGIDTILKEIGSGVLVLDNILCDSIAFDSDDWQDSLTWLQASGSELSEVLFTEVDLQWSVFTGAILDNVSFNGCTLSDSNFDGAFIFECDLSDKELSGSTFRGIDADCVIYAHSDRGRVRLEGKDVIGFLRYKGAATDSLEDYFSYQFHPKFPIMQKISERLTGQRNSQLDGRAIFSDIVSYQKL
jgi:hypothetical protein